MAEIQDFCMLLFESIADTVFGLSNVFKKCTTMPLFLKLIFIVSVLSCSLLVRLGVGVLGSWTCLGL